MIGSEERKIAGPQTGQKPRRLRIGPLKRAGIARDVAPVAIA